MDNKHFSEFEKFSGLGLKKDATKSLRLFIQSLASDEEKTEWVWAYLDKLPQERHSRIRHELFAEVVYPVLKAGFENKNYDATLWLGLLNQNILRNKAILKEINYSGYHFYKCCLKIDPSREQAKIFMLQELIQWFSYIFHEWPSGVLYGPHGATLEECSDIRKELDFSLTLRPSEVQEDEIKEYRAMLTEYEARLQQRKPD